MPTLAIKDGNDTLVYLSVTGTGTSGDPYIPMHTVTQQALVAGTEHIGSVDIDSLPALAAGTALIGGVNIITMAALVTSTAVIGSVHTATYTPTFGTVTTATSATQFASVAGRLFQVKARVGNTGSAYIGHSSGVLSTAGYELAAGEATPWMSLTNLNLLWHISTNATDKLDYIAKT